MLAEELQLTGLISGAELAEVIDKTPPQLFPCASPKIEAAKGHTL